MSESSQYLILGGLNALGAVIDGYKVIYPLGAVLSGFAIFIIHKFTPIILTEGDPLERVSDGFIICVLWPFYWVFIVTHLMIYPEDCVNREWEKKIKDWKYRNVGRRSK